MNDYQVACAAQYAKDYLDALYEDLWIANGHKWPANISREAFMHAYNKLAIALEQEPMPSDYDAAPGHVWEKTTLGWTLRKVNS